MEDNALNAAIHCYSLQLQQLRNNASSRSNLYLGSGLIDQSQQMTAAAMQMADMKVWAHRS